MRKLAGLLMLGLLGSGLAQAGTPPCPVASKYCQPGAAEGHFTLDYAPKAQRQQMRKQFMPQCQSAMVAHMGTGARPVAKAFCTCSVDAILATPGEWRVLRASSKMNPKDVAKMDAALATQTMGQEKACMMAIASGTGLIAPKSAVAGASSASGTPAPAAPTMLNPDPGSPATQQQQQQQFEKMLGGYGTQP